MVRFSLTLTTRENRYHFGVGRNPRGVEITNSQPVRVVVIGAGYAGAACAKSLSKSKLNFKITVIDKRTTSLHKMGGARAAVLGQKFAHRVTIPNQDLVDALNGKVIHGNISEVTAREVVLEDGSTLSFDYLVCATGAKNLGPVEPPLKFGAGGEILRWYERISQKIREARRIAIIGGGAVGVELCGEIKYQYPEKTVSLIHSGATLLDKCDPPVLTRFHRYTIKQLEEIGVLLYLGQKALIGRKEAKGRPYLVGPRMLETSVGNQVQTDLVLFCTGTRPNNTMYPEAWLGPDGTIAVRPTLQLERLGNVFAIGDINSIQENKQGYFAGRQGKAEIYRSPRQWSGVMSVNALGRLAAKNIKRMAGDGEADLASYKPGFGTGQSFVFLSLGPNLGVSNLGYVTLGRHLTRQIKSKNLFTAEQWKVYSQRINLLPDKSSYDRKRRVFSQWQREQDGAMVQPEGARLTLSNFSEYQSDDTEDEMIEAHSVTASEVRRKRRV